MSTPSERELLSPTHSMEPWTVYWVDLKEKDGRWVPWFTYSSAESAREVRDHFKGIKRLNDYCLWPSFVIKDARIRTVKVAVELES